MAAVFTIAPMADAGTQSRWLARSLLAAWFPSLQPVNIVRSDLYGIRIEGDRSIEGSTEKQASKRLTRQNWVYGALEVLQERGVEGKNEQ